MPFRAMRDAFMLSRVRYATLLLSAAEFSAPLLPPRFDAAAIFRAFDAAIALYIFFALIFSDAIYFSDATIFIIYAYTIADV